MNVILCGMMGCGKTTVASALEKQGFTAVDTDALIVERFGNIDNIFSSRGEEYFRDLESDITAEVAKKYDGAVISVGGGCVLRDKNVKNLKAGGKIFYLRTKPETIISRLQGDSSRPLLKGDLSEKVNSILKNRAKIYESVADEIVDTDGLSPQDIAAIIKGKAE